MLSWQRAVLKVGSSLVTPQNGKHEPFMPAIAHFIRECWQDNKEMILVSSGSVAAGRSYFSHTHRTVPIPLKQAMAAIGQIQMMAAWQRFFDFPCAQILLTHSDLHHRRRYINIKNTLRTLREVHCLPVINENDTVSTDELKVGDNDNLAAAVATVAEADLLIICSDVDGLYDRDPRKHKDARLIPEVPTIDRTIYALAGDTTNKIATGGMYTKIQAAEKATSHGIDTLIVNGKDSTTFTTLLQNKNPGTLFKRRIERLSSKKHWLKHILTIKGEINIDDGAVAALTQRGASLLSSGITTIHGSFEKGDAIFIRNNHNHVIAKGISQYSANELQRIKGIKSTDITTILGYCPSEVVIHRDDLIL